MIRLDPVTANSAAPPTVPAWALAAGCELREADAAFRAGAAVASLDSLARAQLSWMGAWRQRLALKCAAASMRLAGRAEDEAALRDAWQLCPAGADPGPAGAILGAWRQLALQPPAVSAERLAKMAELLGLAWDDEALADLCAAIGDQVRGGRPALFGAAAIAARVVAMRPDSESPGWCDRRDAAMGSISATGCFPAIRSAIVQELGEPPLKSRSTPPCFPRTCLPIPR